MCFIEIEIHQCFKFTVIQFILSCAQRAKRARIEKSYEIRLLANCVEDRRVANVKNADFNHIFQLVLSIVSSSKLKVTRKRASE